jgi:hypothetical protein
VRRMGGLQKLRHTMHTIVVQGVNVQGIKFLATDGMLFPAVASVPHAWHGMHVCKYMLGSALCVEPNGQKSHVRQTSL